MFESIKQWFQSDTHSHDFKHIDDARVHMALASVLFHLIDSDDHETKKEHKAFYRILNEEFELSHEQADVLYNTVKDLKTDFDANLQIIHDELKDSPTIKMQFIEKLNRLMNLDGVRNEELEVFYKAVKNIFPEVRL